MKLEKKTTATLLIAILMISMMSVFSVSAGFVIDPAGDIFWGSKAKWTKEDSKVGDWSVHINYEPFEPGFEGCVIIPVKLPLSEIVSKDSNYWFKLITTEDPNHPDQDDYPNYGEVILMIDADGDGEYVHGGDEGGGGDDYLFGEWVYLGTGVSGDDVPVASHDWEQLDINHADLLFWDRFVGSQAPGDDQKSLQWYIDEVDDGGTEDVRTPFTPDRDDGVDITGDSIVMYVCVQSWTGYEAYIDDITMGGVTYSLEPDSAFVGLNAEVVPPKISIGVSETTVDFGTIIAGRSTDPLEVTISNTGEAGVTVTTEMMGNDPAFYDSYLTLDGYSVASFELNIALGAESETVDLVLEVPQFHIAGTYEAVLVFWAEETPT